MNVRRDLRDMSTHPMAEKSRFSVAFSRSTLRVFFLGYSISIRNRTPCDHQPTKPAHQRRHSTILSTPMIYRLSYASLQIDA